MLTEAQVAKARTLPGCGDLTAENAVDKLYAAAESLQNVAADATGKATSAETKVADLQSKLTTAQAAVPAPTSPVVLKAMASASKIVLQSAVDKQAITPAVATALSNALIGTDESPSAVGLTPSASGDCVAATVFSALAANGAAPNVGKEPGTQQAPKAIAGAPADLKPMTAERKKELIELSGVGLPTE